MQRLRPSRSGSIPTPRHVLVAGLAVCALAAVLGTAGACRAGESKLRVTQRLLDYAASSGVASPFAAVASRGEPGSPFESSQKATTEVAATDLVVVPVLLGPQERLEAVRAPVPVRVLGTSTYHGYAIAHLGIPRAEVRALVEGQEIDLVSGTISAPARCQRPERVQAIQAHVAKRVVNPEALASYADLAGSRDSVPQLAFVPSERPSLDGSPVDMLILTRESLLAAFQVYADARTAAGIPTVVRSVEWVEQNFPHGADLQETLRLFLREAYELWGIRFLLLGGDTDVVPARYVHSTTTGSGEVPTDLYYACLDGDWNADGDALWGEAAEFFGPPGDNADLAPELYVGRLPAHSPGEVDLLRTKLATYSEPTVAGYQDKLLFMAEVLWPAGWRPGDPILKNGADYAERLIRLNDLDQGCYRLSRLYDTPAGYPGAVTLTRQASIDSMNAGFNLVTQIGHGFRYTMSLGDASLTNVQAAALTNATRPFFLVMLNCTASAFDFPCLAEQFLLNANGGAVGVIGASREAIPDGSQFYLEAFYESLFGNLRLSAAQALDEARLKWLGETYEDTVFRWTNFITTYLGDPTLAVWRGTVSTPTVSYPASLPVGEQQLTVQVSSAGSPVPGATVCLWKPGDFYAVASTGVSGGAAFSLRSEAPGPLQVTVAGAGIPLCAGLRQHHGSLSLQASGPALRIVAGTQVDDSSLGTIGNGNGMLEAGEEARLLLSVRNDGVSPASNVSLAARTTDPFVGFPDSLLQLGTIAAGQLLAAPPLRIVLDAQLPDLHHVEFEVELRSGAQIWRDRVPMDLLQVGPRPVRLLVQDPDADGTPDPNETYDLLVEFKNYGFAQLDGASATLSSSDPDVTILDGSASLGNVPHLGTGTATFTLRESNVTQDNPLTLSLSDARGHNWSFTIETRRPTAPTGLVADASGGPDIVLLSWSPSGSSDVVGYHVYRALQAAGPWSRASADLVTSGTYFGDHGLAGSTTYHYAAVAVDGSGNESVRSTSVAVTTNPVQNAGWPRLLAQWTSSTAVVADVDGDMSPEVFVGADRVYAWHSGGDEVLDGDANPATDGVFSTLGQGYTAGLAAGDLDGDGADEIVACSWDTHQIFVFDGDGSVRPGWPRSQVATTLGIWATPAVADLDLDGAPEVIVLGLDGRLYVWHGDGSELRDGDANPATQGVFYAIPGSSAWSRGAPAVANILADDATPEIVFGTTGNRIYLLRADGSVPAGWPRLVGDEVTASPSIGDIDGDGDLEIAVAATDGFLYVLQGDGTDLALWPRAMPSVWGALTPSVALHDFDGDGKAELVVGGSDTGQVDRGSLWMFDWQGNVEPGWPVDVHTASEASPVIGDVDGDGVAEILFGGESGKLLGFRPDGTIAPGFPIRLGAEMRSTPTITDLDDDGDVDVVLAGWDQRVYVFDFSGAYVAARVPWGTFKSDSRRTGLYVPPLPTGTGDGLPLPRRTLLHANVPNPFNPRTRLDFEIASAPERARLQIFDAQGRLVRTLVDAVLEPGRYSRIWDGRDASGRESPSGVYFYRLLTSQVAAHRKMTLLR